MTALSPGDLITARKPNQSTEYYLAVYKPPTIFKSTINDANITKGATDVTYGAVITGSVNYIRAGQTLYIGTQSGLSDVGRTRVRNVSGSVISVAIDNKIDYKNGYFIEIRDYYELWPVFSRVVVDNNNNKTYYKDWDISYTNQNSQPMPVPIFGPNYAGFVNPSTRTKVVTFNGTGSYIMKTGDSIQNWFWTFNDSISSPTTSVGPNSVFTGSAGFHTLKLDAISNSSVTGTGYRHICLLDRPGTGPNPPITEWSFDDLSGDYQNGWTAKITVGNRADEFQDGYLVIIFAEDIYDGITGSVHYTDFSTTDNVVFCGYVNKADTWYDWQTSRTTFWLKGTSSYLQNKDIYSITLEYNSNPLDWTQMADMRLNRIIDHFFRWHTTLFNVADYVPLPSQYDFYKRFEDITRGEIFSSINNLLKARVLGQFVSDKQGRCFADVALNYYPTGSRPAAQMTVLDTDWIGQIKFDEIIDGPVSSLMAGGVATSLANLTGTPLLSVAPGLFQTYSGKPDKISGLNFNSQDELNQLAGNVFADRNNRYANLTVKFVNNFRQMDVVPQAYYNFNVAQDRTKRNIVLNNSRFVPIKISYKQKNSSIDVDVTFDSESFGPPGDSYIIPTDVPITTEPDQPPGPPPDPGEIPPSGADGNVVYVVTLDTIGRTRNFLNSNPNWEKVTGGISLTGTQFVDFIVDPYNPPNVGYALTTVALWKTLNLNSPSPIWTVAVTAASLGFSSFYREQASIVAQDFIVLMGVKTGTAYTIRVTHSHDGGSTWTSVDVGSNFGGNAVRGISGFFVSQHDNNKIWTANAGGSIYYSSDGGHSFVQKITFSSFYTPVAIYIPYDNNPNDQIGIVAGGSSSTNAAYIKLTTNGFTTLTDISSQASGHQDGVGTANGDTNKNYCIQMFDDKQIQILGTASYDQFGHEAAHYIKSNDAGQTWVKLKDFAAPAGIVNQLGTWPYNKNILYALGNSTDGYILNSIDGGVTWKDKIGDWTVVMGSVPKGRVMIVPIWVGL